MVSSHSYHLNMLLEIHNVFHVQLLCPAATDLFPSQQQSDWQPLEITTEKEKKYEIEDILKK
ncbi:hypothetical protein CIHG_10191 [Coccidioides immitis H538.4]|uniref:Uncharacterized protein n=1 Tax=Coccidioides immitis H538.4 TaxID=396776 RepID=A0A0J8S7I8_COCIT|nr:hypothetical protein CIHG_10191 [Coccidioides immitis H538.4]